MNVCFAILYSGSGAGSHQVERYLDERPILRGLPRAMAERGHRVDVVQAFPASASLVESGIRYHFVDSNRGIWAGMGALTRLAGRDRALYEPAPGAIRRIRSLRPDVVHFHGLTLNLNLFLLMRSLRSTGIPVVVQYHGGGPARHRVTRRLQRANLMSAAALLFSTRAHAEPFIQAGIVDPGRVVEFMETSSDFQPCPRPNARRRTGMSGEPVFVWTGRLHPVKDPLTALRGFERIVGAWPSAQLYLYYLTDELLPDLHAFVDARPSLAEHVHFRGRAPYDQMESIYNSADFLLQASRHEIGGYAVLEALACGVIPVVTDIPAFRAMTGDGRYGILFPVGDDGALARGTLEIRPDEIPERSAAARRWFEQALSFPALASRLEEIHRRAILTRHL